MTHVPGVAAAVLALMLSSCAPRTGPEPASADWLVYGGDKANTKSSPLVQIHRGNLDRVKIAWRWRSLSNDVDLDSTNLLRFTYQSTPLARDGILYATIELSQVAAVDGASGIGDDTVEGRPP